MDRDFNPKDGGYVQIMNEFLEYLYQVDLAPAEHRLIDFFMRWIWGNQGRAWAPFSWSYIRTKTGITDSTLTRALTNLKNRNAIFTKTQEHQKYYKINSKTSTWRITPKNGRDTPKNGRGKSRPKMGVSRPKLGVITPKNGRPTFKNNKKTIKKHIKAGAEVIHTKTDSEIIIDFINELSGKEFKYSKTSLTPINKALKEGYTLEQCLTVCQQKWLDTDFKEQ
jgi:uncharacterized phage protein (TIGR02220 family)